MSSKKKEMLSSMCEMFPNLEPALVEMVLSEYTEVELVMDYLLELSTGAKMESKMDTSGFEKITAYLDGFRTNSPSSENETNVAVKADNNLDDQCIDNTLSDNLDMLLDEALDMYGFKNSEEFYITVQPESSASEASTRHVLSEQVLTTSSENASFHTECMENFEQPHISLTGAEKLHLGDSPHKSNTTTMSTTSSAKPNISELEKTEVNCKTLPSTNDNFLQNKIGATNSPRHLANNEIPGGQKPSHGSKQSVFTSAPNVPNIPGVSSKSQINWNPFASSFVPASNKQCSFITPVVANNIQWSYGACAGQPSTIVSNTPPVPSAYAWNSFTPTRWTAANVPKSVTKPKSQPQFSTHISKKVTRLVGKVLILLRGAPGSGKSTLARVILEQNPTGVILSTDDYFSQNGHYQFDVLCLSEAHEWNQKRAKDAFEKKVTPIIIDNTNLQGWEMMPYVSMAKKFKYNVTFREPDTWWKYNPKELERRNIHGVKKEKILKMLDHFERVTVNSILKLSSEKEPEKDGISQRKTDERIGARNDLIKDDNLSTTEAKNPSDTDVAAISTDKNLVSDEGRSGPEILVNMIESREQCLKNANDEPEKYSDNVQRLKDNTFINQPYSIEHVSTEICLHEVSTYKEDTSDIGCNVSQLDERPELTSFVGDWPLEQTLSQRSPRKRKKAKPKPTQQSGKEEQNGDMLVSTKDVAIVESKMDEETTETSVESHGKEADFQKMENQIHTILSYNNDEVNESGVKSSSKVLQQDLYVDINPDISDVTAGLELKTRPGKRSCRNCKLALTFSNRFSISCRTDGTSAPCELTEAVDQSSSGISACTQTEPHEFAIAWRVEKKNLEVFEFLKVLTGKVERFKSQSLETKDCSQENIPYRMMHHKSTYVDEDEISVKEDGLQILCKLFRSLSFDVLKDLYERCNKDLEWATNLLLDSGEKIYKEEYDEEEWLKESSCENVENECSQDDAHLSTAENSELTEQHYASLKMDDSSTDSSDIALENCSLDNSFSLIVAEELKNGNVLSSSDANDATNQCILLDSEQPDEATIPDTIEAHMVWSSSLEGGQINSQDPTLSIEIETNNILNEKTIKEDFTQEINSPNDIIPCEADDHQDDISTDHVYKDKQNADTLPITAEANKPQDNSSLPPKESLKFDHLELSLPPELAFQLTELFGPVGIDPGSLTIEDCLVPINLKLAEEIHKNWKQSIKERHNQEALSYQLLLEDYSTDDHINLDRLLQEQDSRSSENNLYLSKGETDMFPFIDQWNNTVKKVCLRKIMSEEMALQAREEMKKPQAMSNCAVRMKVKQLLELFPNLEKSLLMDIFKENNYSLEKTEEFFSSVLEADPVQNVIAPGFKKEVPSSTERMKEKKKKDKEDLNKRYFQDLDCPEYDDFRAESILYRKKQQESYQRAAEAHYRGMKQVATFYAQQGCMYGQKMKESNHRAAVKIFERTNEYLLPENILDLHGLHVDEAMKHFRQVLQDKTEDYRKNGGSSHLVVITGRGNRSQGGVPRIKPAILDYLTNHDYRFQEKTPGSFCITLK